MSILKVIEVLANSPTSWEDAARQAISNASETIHDIRSVYIKDHSAIVEGGKIVEYRITAKVTFEIKHE